MAARFLVFLILVVAISADVAAAETSRKLYVFDDAGAADQWVAAGNIPLEIASPPEVAAGGAPSGTALHLKTAGSAGVFTQRHAVPLDWTTVKEATFWVYRSADAAAADDVSSIEVQFVEGNGKTKHWRRVDLDHTGWKQYSVATRWCYWSPGTIPQWENVARIGFWCREASDFWIDDVGVVEDSGAKPTEISDEELRELAFPGAGEKARIAHGENVTIMTDVAELDAPQLAAHLDKAAAAVAEDMPFLGVAPKGKLVVQPNRAAFEQFIVRAAAKLNMVSQPPGGTGFTFFGIAATYWDPEYGTLRPVYLHEFVHSYLEDSIQIANRREWLHEGLAGYYQQRFHPQANFSESVHSMILSERFKPFDQLTNGAAIELTDYWQAATLTDMLLHDEYYKTKWPQLLVAIRDASNSDLRPHLQTVFGKTYEEFTSDWQAFCRRTY